MSEHPARHSAYTTIVDGITVRFTNHPPNTMLGESSYQKEGNDEIINIALGEVSYQHTQDWLTEALLCKEGVCTLTFLTPNTLDELLSRGITPYIFGAIDTADEQFILSSIDLGALKQMPYLPNDLVQGGKIKKNALPRSADYAIPGKAKSSKALNTRAREIRSLCGAQMLLLYSHLNKEGINIEQFEGQLVQEILAHEMRHSKQSELFPGLSLLRDFISLEGILEYYESKHDKPFPVDGEFVERYLTVFPSLFRVLSLIEADAVASAWVDRVPTLSDQLMLYYMISNTLHTFEATGRGKSAFEEGILDVKRKGYPESLFKDDPVGFEHHTLGNLAMFSFSPNLYNTIINGPSVKITAQTIAARALEGMRLALTSDEKFRSALRLAGFREQLNQAMADSLRILEAKQREFYNWLDSRTP